MIAFALLLLRLVPACPVEGARVSSEFGMRDHPILNQRKLHRGIDLAAPKGAEVRAIWNGIVVKSKSSHGGYGRIVVIESGKRRVLYAHLSKRLVREGDAVVAGDVVGLVGSSGAATGPHLHLGIFGDGGRQVQNANFVARACE